MLRCAPHNVAIVIPTRVKVTRRLKDIVARIRRTRIARYKVDEDISKKPNPRRVRIIKKSRKKVLDCLFKFYIIVRIFLYYTHTIFEHEIEDETLLQYFKDNARLAHRFRLNPSTFLVRFLRRVGGSSRPKATGARVFKRVNPRVGWDTPAAAMRRQTEIVPLSR